METAVTTEYRVICTKKFAHVFKNPGLCWSLHCTVCAIRTHPTKLTHHVCFTQSHVPKPHQFKETRGVRNAPLRC
ncbi:hypothetical protein COLO4_37890 [Corchorus olitorius]|uniref:Uncharacterized protein n=1 Tax=Corchorus olitorius TaxID=93759 RepID=A0A1R3FYE4_9ROSI|nr:hypothetical protein COLO4_37890 [Corchorus olitorius]